MVVALAGRRIDAADAIERRFPAKHVTVVRSRLRELLIDIGARALVTSAACGADLIALEVAGELKLRRRVILPFEASRFRDTSVTDRPGRWGEAFDRVIEEAGAAGDVVIVGSSSAAAYEAANHAVFDEAGTLGAQLGSSAAAVVVWNGQSRGPDDFTAQFRDQAERRGLRVYEVSTL
jgi:hypothetical protein